MENVNNIISLVASGLSIIPIHEGGKEPAYWLGKTEPFINLRATNAQVMEWVKRGVKSWGLFSGPISGNVATLDFDEKWQIGLYDAFYAKLSDEQKAYVDKCIKNKTRNNGTHIICRTDTTQKSTDLAKGLRLAKNKKPSRDHDAIEGMQTLIETRGEGNYVLIPPSPGYETLQGDLMSVPNIGDDMWEQLCDIARTFNEVTEEPETEYEHKQTNSSNADLPGNRFNEIATWKEILEPYGWIEVYPNGWARPGKGKNDGISATTNHDDKPILYVFSSNAQPFKGPHGDKKGTGYTKFHAYTLLNHNGDFSVSAKEILKNENITNGNKSDYISGKVQENNKKEDSIKFVSALSHSELISKIFSPARYTIEPFFEQGTMNMVSAPPNTWKSWLLFLFAGHIVAGSSVFDKFSTTKANVMIVNEEDSARLIQDRLKLLKIIDPSLPIYYRIAQGSKLTKDFVDFLIKEAKEKNIGVIMFDSLRATHDADENSSTEIQGVMDLLKRISREDITVIFTHHHRKKSMFKNSDDKESSRGSSAINAAVSGHISLEEVEKEDGKYLILKHLKSKVGEKLQPFDIEIKTDDGVSFQYLGEHQPKEQALVEAKSGILLELQDKDELLGRKDFVQLKIAGTTTIRDATKILEKEGKIVVILRRDAEKTGRRMFSSEGKANEKLYSIKKEDDFGDYNDLPNGDT